MKQIKTKYGDILVIEIPKDTTENIKHYYNLKLYNNELVYTDRVIGKLSELSDEDCKKFIEKHPNIAYKDYMVSTLSKAINGWTANWLIQSAKQSFISLLQSKDIDTTKEWIILKKI